MGIRPLCQSPRRRRRPRRRCRPAAPPVRRRHRLHPQRAAGPQPPPARAQDRAARPRAAGGRSSRRRMAGLVPARDRRDRRGPSPCRPSCPPTDDQRRADAIAAELPAGFLAIHPGKRFAGEELAGGAVRAISRDRAAARAGCSSAGPPTTPPRPFSGDGARRACRAGPSAAGAGRAPRPRRRLRGQRLGHHPPRRGERRADDRAVRGDRPAAVGARSGRASKSSRGQTMEAIAGGGGRGRGRPVRARYVIGARTSMRLIRR